MTPYSPVATFRRNTLIPFSGLLFPSYHLLGKLFDSKDGSRSSIPLKRRHTSTRLHGITSQQILLFAIIDIRTSNSSCTKRCSYTDSQKLLIPLITQSEIMTLLKQNKCYLLINHILFRLWFPEIIRTLRQR
jgi:hypothetical protein